MKPGVFVLTLLLGASGKAQADCPAPAGSDAAALTAHDDAARLAWIQARFARTSHRSKIWLHGWEIGILGATAVDLAMIPILGDTRSNRIDFGLGAATTIIGIPPLLLWQPRILDEHRALQARIDKGDADTCTLLADAEQRLVAVAAAQHTQRAWYMHAGNVLLNGGVTLLFGAFGHWNVGILNGVGGALVGELIIFTEPIDQIDDLAHYRRGDFTDPERHAWQLVPMPTPNGMGVAIAIPLP